MADWDLTSDTGDGQLSEILPIALSALRQAARTIDLDLRIGRPQCEWQDTDQELRTVLDDRFTLFSGLRSQVFACADALNRALDEDTIQHGRGALSHQPRMMIAAWLFAGRKPIHLGVIERYFIYPASPPLNTNLLKLVVALPGMADVLIREQHDVFGWHYHYCDQRQRRSDVLMSFDRRRGSKQLPLCWEPHGVNKAKFTAKPWLWRERKRETIYTACAPDLEIVPPLTFKPPSKEAQNVWPI